MADRSTIEQQIEDALAGGPGYELETMFPKREGFGAARAVKAKLKLLQKLCPELSTALVDGEQLVYVARGYVVNWWEQLFAGGMVAYYANITCVVLTDRRIILVNSDSAGKPKLFRNQILYTEVKKAKLRSALSSAAKLTLADGRSLVIGGFKGIDRKQMQPLIEERVAAMPEGAPRVAKSVQYLCPHCAAIYTEHVESCESCATSFKSPRKAATMSLFLPGLGDIYLGHRFLGSLELLGSIFEWVVLLALISGAAMGDAESRASIPLWLGIIVVTNLIDFFLTRAMARKGLIATGRSGKAAS